jgi:hypothetical protein
MYICDIATKLTFSQVISRYPEMIDHSCNGVMHGASENC